MRKLLLLLFVFSFYNLYSQDTEEKIDYNLCKDTISRSYLIMEFGLTFPSITIIDNNNNTLDNLTKFSDSKVSLGYGSSFGRLGFYTTIFDSKFKTQGYFEGNSSLVIYDFEYVGIDLGLTLDLIDTEFYNFTFKGGGSYNYLLSGSQEYNSQTVSLLDSDEYDNDYFDYDIGVQLSKKITTNSDVYVGYSHSRSFEFGDPDNFKFDINSNTALLGFRINFDCISPQDQIDRLNKMQDNIAQNAFSLEELSKKEMNYQDLDKKYAAKDHIHPIDSAYIINQSVIDLYQRPAAVVLFPVNETTSYYEVFQQDLEDLLETINLTANSKITIVGYSDLSGNQLINLDLSKARATSISQYFVDNGVDPGIINIEFRGSTSRFDQKVLMSNRRVEVFIH